MINEMKKLLLVIIVATMMVAFFVGQKVGKETAIKTAKIINVTDSEVFIDFGSIRLDDGKLSDSNVHVYSYN